MCVTESGRPDGHAWVTWPRRSTIWVQKSEGFVGCLVYSVGEIRQEIVQKPPTQTKTTAKTFCWPFWKWQSETSGSSIGFVSVKFNNQGWHQLFGELGRFLEDFCWHWLLIICLKLQGLVSPLIVRSSQVVFQTREISQKVLEELTLPCCVYVLPT